MCIAIAIALTLHCFADLRTNSDDTRDHWFRPYFMTKQEKECFQWNVQVSYRIASYRRLSRFHPQSSSTRRLAVQIAFVDCCTTQTCCSNKIFSCFSPSRSLRRHRSCFHSRRSKCPCFAASAHSSLVAVALVFVVLDDCGVLLFDLDLNLLFARRQRCS